MQSVPAPPRLAPRTGGAALAFGIAAVVAAVIVLLAVASQGGHEQAPARAAPAYNGLIGGVPLQNAHCMQWNAGSGAERDRTAAALAHSVGGATTYGRGTTLTTAQTHTLFDNACASPIAQHWLLYELYIRAAGFRSYVPR
jgi:hypothetical protein